MATAYINSKTINMKGLALKVDQLLDSSNNPVDVADLAALTTTELGYLDGVTPGTVAASKVVIVDANSAMDVVNTAALSLGASGSETLVSSTAAELNYLDLTTGPGTAEASKAVVLDASKDVGDLRNLDAVNIDAGASGTAGTVDVFPSSATSGKIQIAAADNAGDTTTTITNASMAAARTITFQDPGADADVMYTGAQVSLTANTDDGAASTISAGVNDVVVAAVNSDANDWVNLPAGTAGVVVRGWSVVAHELRTPAASTATINNVNADSTNEAAIPATTMWEARCVATDTWVLRAWDELGAVITAIVPD